MKLLLTYSRRGQSDPGRKPVIARIVKETGILVNVEKANIDSTAGEVLIDIPDADADLVRRCLEEMGVAVRVMVPRTGAQRLMDELYEVGARAILTTGIHAARI